MKSIIILMGVISTLFITGCGSKMTAEDCGAADWKAIGLEDASGGLPAEATFAKRQSECGAFNIAANKEQYTHGYAQGLIAFCTAENGYKYGRRGRRIKSSICVGDLAVAFQQGYDKGREDYLEERRQKALIQAASTDTGANDEEEGNN